MKKIILLINFTIFNVYIFAVGFQISFSGSNFALNKDSSFRKIPDFGGLFSIEENMTAQIRGKLVIERDAENGNTIWSRISYDTTYLSISIGPSLGFFNTTGNKNDILTLFQPGLGIGMKFFSPGGFFAGIDTSFSLATMSITENTVYLQSGFINAGFLFPNIFAELKITQKNKTLITEGKYLYFSITDYGLYTEAFSKASGVRFPINLYFRHSRYLVKNEPQLKKEFGFVIAEAGLTHAVNNETEWYFLFGSSVYTFALTKEKNALKNFFFKAEFGVRFSV